jgi:hypothetical protein
MEHFIIYMVKASALIGLFFLAYHLFLRKETFFNSNRWFLIAGLLTSVVLPAIVYTEVIWIEVQPQRQAYQEINLDELMVLHQQTFQAPAREAVSINWFDVAAGIYLAGAVFFLIRFIIEVLSLRRQLKGLPIIKDGKFLLVDSPVVKSPFSFFNYIVYNSAILQPEELESILSHEKVHSSQKHSMDMVISQLFCVAFWFNPFAWIYRKSISQNLEFIADAEATRVIADKEAYQKTLLKITVQPECIAITNHFYQSLIKKRIVMLNKQQSKKRNSWKYAIVLPALVAFMLLFQVQVVAQVKEAPETKAVTKTKMKISVEVTKDSKDEELQAESKIFKEEFDADVNFENIKRNQKNEITAIKVTVKDKTQSKVYEVAGTEPIVPFTVEMEKKGNGSTNSISFGSSRSMVIANGATFFHEGDSLRSAHKIMRSYTMGDEMPVPPVPPVPGDARVYRIPPAGNMQGSTTLNIGDKDMLIVINGVKQKKGEVIKLPLNEDVAAINMLEGKEGKKKYGKDGKKGVVEITTHKSNNRIIMRNPHAYFDIPEMNGESFSFSFDFDNEDIARSLRDGMESLKMLDGMKFYGDALSAEEMAKIQEELSQAQAEIQKSMDELKFDFNNDMSEDEIQKIREELKEARKELMEARREMMKDREKAAKESNKEAAKAKRTVYKKA